MVVAIATARAVGQDSRLVINGGALRATWRL
jgi:hypothetical protein